MSIFLITGGSGFIGSNFIDKIIRVKNIRVINIDLKKPYKIVLHQNNKNYTFIKGNINNKALISKILKKYKPNFIINFAAQTHVDKSIYNPKSFFKNNVEGTLSLLQCLVKINFKYKFVHISTDEVYGDLTLNQERFDEISKISPNNPYSISKAASDFMVSYFVKSYNLNCVITRCSNNFGKWQHPEKLIPNTIMNCIRKNKIPVYGNGKNIRDWIHVEDHCQGIYQAAKYGKKGSVYLIGSNNEVRNINIVNLIVKYFNKKDKEFNYNSLIQFVKDRLNHDRRYAINFNKSKKELKYKPIKQFEVSLVETIKHYIDNQKFYKNIILKSIWFKKHYG